MAVASSLEVEDPDGARRVYRAEFVDAEGERFTSPAERSFCSLCASALWLWDPRWPELVHPFASAVDTDLPAPPERAHILLESCASWVVPQVGRETCASTVCRRSRSRTGIGRAGCGWGDDRPGPGRPIPNDESADEAPSRCAARAAPRVRACQRSALLTAGFTSAAAAHSPGCPARTTPRPGRRPRPCRSHSARRPPPCRPAAAAEWRPPSMSERFSPLRDRKAARRRSSSA